MSAQFFSPFFIPKDGRKLLQLSRHMSSGLLQMHCLFNILWGSESAWDNAQSNRGLLSSPTKQLMKLISTLGTSQPRISFLAESSSS